MKLLLNYEDHREDLYPPHPKESRGGGRQPRDHRKTRTEHTLLTWTQSGGGNLRSLHLLLIPTFTWALKSLHTIPARLWLTV